MSLLEVAAESWHGLAHNNIFMLDFALSHCRSINLLAYTAYIAIFDLIRDETRGELVCCESSTRTGGARWRRGVAPRKLNRERERKWKMKSSVEEATFY